MDVFNVLRRPVVTEKSTLLQERNKFVFEISQNANKSQVREAVERAFNVKVISVRIARSGDEVRRFGRATDVTVPGIKKAIVTLRSGDTIQIFEGA